MEIEETPIKDLYIIEQPKYIVMIGDILWNHSKMHSLKKIYPKFYSRQRINVKKGVIEGLHCQLPPYEQTKLVRVIQGEILDVAVDVRKKSQTYGNFFQIKLNDETKNNF